MTLPITYGDTTHRITKHPHENQVATDDSPSGSESRRGGIDPPSGKGEMKCHTNAAEYLRQATFAMAQRLKGAGRKATCIMSRLLVIAGFTSSLPML